MTKEEMQSLSEGDIVTSNADGSAYMIMYVSGTKIVGVRTVDITNSSEWKIAARAKYENVARSARS